MKTANRRLGNRKSPAPLELGKYIVADPGICHGKPTFRGTRVFVADVLEQVAQGMSWDRIIREWHGSITKPAIREALELSHRVFLEHLSDYTVKPTARR